MITVLSILLSRSKFCVLSFFFFGQVFTTLVLSGLLYYNIYILCIMKTAILVSNY